MDILGPDRGEMTMYGSDFQQVNLTPNGGVSPTVYTDSSFFICIALSILLFVCVVAL